MKFYRFEVTYYEGDEDITEHGLIAAESIGLATSQLTEYFVEDEKIESISIRLFYPEDCGGCMLVSKEILDAMEQEVIW